MNNKEFITKMKELKQELEKYSEFSEKEKEILFDNLSRKMLFEEEQIRDNLIALQHKKSSINQNFSESFASLINRAKVSQHMDYVMLASYHLIKNEGLESFSVKDVNLEYKKAYVKPSNTNVFLVNLVKKGLLMSAGKREGNIAFAITREGIKYVEDLLQNGE